MPEKNSFKESIEAAVANATSKRKTGAVSDDTTKKVSQLATATSISAFVAAACLVFSFVTHAQATAAIAEVQSDLVETVVAVKDIPKGAVIKKDMVEVAHIPSKFVSGDAVASPDKAIGKQASTRISGNSQIQTGALSGEENNSSLSGRIKKGNKAVSIDVTTESDFACSLLHQGDRVSLYCFTGSQGGEKTKCELARDVEVVALDGALSYDSLKEGKGGVSYSNVTVEVDPATAVKIRETQDNGKTIWFVLSSETDTKK